MTFHRPIIAATAFVLLSSAVFAQVDPHHPKEGQPSVTTESAAPTEGSVEKAPAPSSSAPAPAAPVPAAPQTMPMMQMMGQMQMMHMLQMQEAEMMHMQQMHQMETMHAKQMRDMQMHRMMARMGAMPGMMPGMDMMTLHGSGAAPAAPAMPGTAQPAPMGEGMATPTSSDPDIAFVQSMIPHHEGAIAMAEEVLRTGSDEEVQTWAREIIAAQQAEIAELRAWLDRHRQ